MKPHPLIALAGLAPALAASPALADQVTLTPVHDATLYFDLLGDLANGSGQYIFAGNDGSAEAKRALLQFDLSSIPPGSTIEQVTLKVTLTRSAGFQTTFNVSLHRVTRAWHEGPTAPGGEEGGGGISGVGDVTWLHTFYDSQFWAVAGGDFVAGASATLPIASSDHPQNYTFGPTAGMAADVQAWVNAGASNFGWLMRGDETVAGTARRFNSRENTDAATRPLLQVNYTPPNPPPGCYPNCDHSTALPFLNVQDFTCFLTKYASGDPYANCDASTTPPTLNVQDFTCFLQKFAAGCSAP